MTPGDRFKKWVDDFAVSIKDRVRGWMVSWATKGITDALEDMEPEQKAALLSTVERVIANPNVPPEVKRFLEQVTKKGNPLFVAAGVAMIVAMIIQTVTTIWQPGTNQLSYIEERLARTYRLDPFQVIAAWRRDPATYEKYFDDLRDQGWSDARIEALKFVTLFYPAPADLVRWQAREVFEPKMIEKYGLDAELGEIERGPFYKAGMTDEQITNYWRAHWEHASWIQVVEMVRRGQMTEQDVWDWFRLVEIPPFWRDKLIAISWEIPTRVDIRRFFDLKTIDETRLRELYTAHGYRGKDLDDYVLWTKIYVELPDLLARWKNGWITLDDVRARLIADGMAPDAADELIQTKVKSIEPTSTAEGKELTKAEIYKGVKQGVITPDEGIDLLLDLDYSRDQAEYLLVTNVAVLAGSPEMYTDFKDITQKYRKAAGLPSKPVPYELQQAALELVRITKERDRLKEAVDQEQAKLIPDVVLPEGATERLFELEVALHRAESEVARLKQHYEAQLAEYKHGV